MSRTHIESCHLYLIASCESAPTHSNGAVLCALTEKGIAYARQLGKTFAEDKTIFSHLRRGENCADGQTTSFILEATNTRPNRSFSRPSDEYRFTLKSYEATAKLNSFSETGWKQRSARTVQWFEQSLMQDKRITRKQSTIAIVADPIAILALVVHLTDGRFHGHLEPGSLSRFELRENSWREHYTNLIKEPMPSTLIACV